jgi:hypothetical protein
MCDLAFFDRQDRLCVIGIVRTVSTPRLPLAISQMMLVAHLADIRPVEEVEISVAVVTMAHQYVLVMLRELPFREEGVYRFEITLTGQSVASIDIPVLTTARPVSVEVH